MKFKAYLRIIVIGYFLELLLGCSPPVAVSTKNTTPIPVNAVIKAGHTGLSAFVTSTAIFITAVDGQEILSSAVEVSPGIHQLQVSWRQESSYDKTAWSASTEMKLMARAGHQYIVKGIPNVNDSNSSTPQFTVTFWIEDEQSGEIVSGKKPQHAQ
ncbi:MAG: hypothetical protein HC877_09340 [Thioploca sp.]|nr:hypothetical protein [Thioploca sp.]